MNERNAFLWCNLGYTLLQILSLPLDSVSIMGNEETLEPDKTLYQAKPVVTNELILEHHIANHIISRHQNPGQSSSFKPTSTFNKSFNLTATLVFLTRRALRGNHPRCIYIPEDEFHSSFRCVFDVEKIIGYAEDNTPCRKIVVVYETSRHHGYRWKIKTAYPLIEACKYQNERKRN